MLINQLEDARPTLFDLALERSHFAKLVCRNVLGKAEPALHVVFGHQIISPSVEHVSRECVDLGSARVSRVGRGISRRRTFVVGPARALLLRFQRSVFR